MNELRGVSVRFFPPDIPDGIQGNYCAYILTQESLVLMTAALPRKQNYKYPITTKDARSFKYRLCLREVYMRVNYVRYTPMKEIHTINRTREEQSKEET